MTVALSTTNTSAFKAPVWVSGFRPFYLVAAIYGPLLMLYGLTVYLGGLASISDLPFFLWHGHEMIFGFAAAIATGFILTALPGWAGTKEISRASLVALTTAWLAGRLVFWFSGLLPPVIVATVDSLHFLLLALMIAPGLLKAENKLYLLLLPILASFVAANIWYHTGAINLAVEQAELGVRISVYTLMTLFVFVGGFLTPIFTENHLRTKGCMDCIGFKPFLETLAVISIVLFGITGVLAVESWLSIGAALFALVIHSIRMIRWRGWLALGDPLVWAMQAGYLWLLTTFVVRAYVDYTGNGSPDLAIHAFTLGAFGMMKMSLMTRVALRHTGRRMKAPKMLVLAYWLMLLAAVTRLLAGVVAFEPALIVISGLLWSLCWLIYLGQFGRILISPSLPRSGATPLSIPVRQG